MIRRRFRVPEVQVFDNQKPHGDMDYKYYPIADSPVHSSVDGAKLLLVLVLCFVDVVKITHGD